MVLLGHALDYCAPMTRTLLALLLLAAPGLASRAEAQIRISPSDDAEAMLAALGPGDEAILEDGMYTLTERFSFDLTGTAEAPILIRAADGARPHFHRPNASQNIWDIRATHVTVRGIEFSGGSAGVRVEAASDFTFEDCEIHETEDVALRMNDGGQTYTRVNILRNHLHDTGGTGEGMYLGCNEDGCRLVDAVIAGNYVHHTNAGDVSQGDGIELKEGSYGCVIADNVIHDTNYPCILGYGAVGNGAPNVVERNVMWNCGDHAIQWAADARIRNNIVLSAVGSGIASQMHQNASPSNLEIVHNTIVVPGGPAISVRNASGAVLIANNALYAMSGPALLVRGSDATLTIEGNVGVGGLDGITTTGIADGVLAADFLGASYSGAVPNDVFPTSSGALAGAGASAHVVSLDFNGSTRGGAADVGAYALGGGANPGWTLAEEFRPPAGGEPPVGVDGGPSDRDGGPSDADAGPSDRDAAPGVDAGPTATAEAGCSCRAGGARGGGPGTYALAPLLALVLVARRRRVR